MNGGFYNRRLTKERQFLQESKRLQEVLIKEKGNLRSPLLIVAAFPEDSPYEEYGSFAIMVKLPASWPATPPEFSIPNFSRIWHPNIHNGRICLDRFSENWSSIIKLEDCVAMYFMQLLQYENLKDPFNSVANKEFEEARAEKDSTAKLKQCLRERMGPPEEYKAYFQQELDAWRVKWSSENSKKRKHSGEVKQPGNFQCDVDKEQEYLRSDVLDEEEYQDAIMAEQQYYGSTV